MMKKYTIRLVNPTRYYAASCNKIAAIKCIKNITGMALAETRAFIDLVTSDFVLSQTFTTRDQVESYVFSLEGQLQILRDSGFDVNEVGGDSSMKFHLKQAALAAMDEDQYHIAMDILTILKGL